MNPFQYFARRRETQRLISQATRLPRTTEGQAIQAVGLGEISLEQYRCVMQTLGFVISH